MGLKTLPCTETDSDIEIDFGVDLLIFTRALLTVHWQVELSPYSD
jgi:hypothetical protein